MAIPKPDLRGQTCTITMMELRGNPGSTIDAVEAGLMVWITKAGKHVATLVPPGGADDTTIVHADGSIEGTNPLTYRRPDLIRQS